MRRYTIYFLLLLFAFVSCKMQQQEQSTQSSPNVLFITVDDLRTELNCYGADHIQSPNIDRLAASGIRFDQAHVQQAICMASRASMLTGIRPERYGIYAGEAVGDLTPDVLTMNQFFEENGYTIAALGKIYHYKADRIDQFGENYIKEGKDWVGNNYVLPASEEAFRTNPEQRRGPAYEMADVKDDAYPDGTNAVNAVQKLKELSNTNQPFFLSVGFKRPHLPFTAPKKYWDMYAAADIKLPKLDQHPQNSNKYTMRVKGELTNYYGTPNTYEELSDSTELTLRRAYYACVSYVDAQIGKILNQLEASGLSENTIVVLWGDHGYKLGEYGNWCKWSNMNIDTRIPLIIRTPNGKKGQVHRSPVEALDVYPTLAELCGFTIPSHVEGKSLVATLDSPKIITDRVAFSCWPHDRKNYEKTVMGYSAKTGRYNYVEWVKLSTGEVLAKELYDHLKDPEETINVADKQEYETVINSLAKMVAVRKKATDHDHPFKRIAD